MANNDIQEIGETIVKKKRSRPDRTVQTEPGDNRKYIRHTMQIAKLPKINIKDSAQVESRVNEYFKICDDNDMKPSVAGLALALDTERSYLWKIRTGQAEGYPPDVRHTLKRAVTTINSMMEDYMQNGKINPVSGIFLMKNNMDYTDKQEVVVTPSQPLGDLDSVEKLEEKYKDSVIVETDGSEVDE